MSVFCLHFEYDFVTKHTTESLSGL